MKAYTPLMEPLREGERMRGRRFEAFTQGGSRKGFYLFHASFSHLREE